MPNARDVTGVGYPILTNRALVKFTNDPNHPMVTGPPEGKACTADTTGNVPLGCPVRTCQTSMPPMQEKIIDEMRRLCGRQLPVIYPIESGLVPHYTGHIPGMKEPSVSSFSSPSSSSSPSSLLCFIFPLF